MLHIAKCRLLLFMHNLFQSIVAAILPVYVKRVIFIAAGAAALNQASPDKLRSLLADINAQWQLVHDVNGLYTISETVRHVWKKEDINESIKYALTADANNIKKRNNELDELIPFINEQNVFFMTLAAAMVAAAPKWIRYSNERRMVLDLSYIAKRFSTDYYCHV